MTTRVETAMSVAIVDCRVMDRNSAITMPAIASRWTALGAALMRWLARRRLSRSIAHLDDRMLADIGLSPRDLGLVERLVRPYVAGGTFWAGDKTGR